MKTTEISQSPQSIYHNKLKIAKFKYKNLEYDKSPITDDNEIIRPLLQTISLGNFFFIINIAELKVEKFWGIKEILGYEEWNTQQYISSTHPMYRDAVSLLGDITFDITSTNKNKYKPNEDVLTFIQAIQNASGEYIMIRVASTPILMAKTGEMIKYMNYCTVLHTGFLFLPPSPNLYKLEDGIMKDNNELSIIKKGLYRKQRLETGKYVKWSPIEREVLLAITRCNILEWNDESKKKVQEELLKRQEELSKKNGDKNAIFSIKTNQIKQINRAVDRIKKKIKNDYTESFPKDIIIVIAQFLNESFLI